MTKTKETHAFILKFREKDRHTVQFLFAQSFTNIESSTNISKLDIALSDVETKIKWAISTNEFAKPFVSRLLETIKENRDLAKSFGELYVRSD